jgi:hypothetical protein
MHRTKVTTAQDHILIPSNPNHKTVCIAHLFPFSWRHSSLTALYASRLATTISAALLLDTSPLMIEISFPFLHVSSYEKGFSTDEENNSALASFGPTDCVICRNLKLQGTVRASFFLKRRCASSASGGI